MSPACSPRIPSKKAKFDGLVPVSVPNTNEISAIQREIELLDIFEHELPDPGCFLYPNPVFWLFPKLPIELRVMIWNKSMSPRLIQVECPAYSDGRVRNRVLRIIERYTRSRDTMPIVLYVNQESRTEGLKHYELAVNRVINGEIVRTTWTNPKLDTVALVGLRDPSEMRHHPWFFARLFKVAQHLQCNDAQWAAESSFLTAVDDPQLGIAASLSTFESLKTLTIQFPRPHNRQGKFSDAELDQLCQHIRGLFEAVESKPGIHIPEIIPERVPGRWDPYYGFYMEGA